MRRPSFRAFQTGMELSLAHSKTYLLWKAVYPMNSRISHQLLILGNGFDIICGLNSRFVQFFRPRMAVIDKNKIIRKKGWAEALSASGITAWELILYYGKELADKGYDVNWSDIELVVSDALEMVHNFSALPSFPSMDKQHFVTIRTLLEYFEFLQSRC